MRLNVKYHLRKVGDESIIVIPESGDGIRVKAVCANPTSAWLIESLAGREFSVSDVSRLLRSKFTVDALVADFDASEWVNQLVTLGIVEK